MGIFRRSSSIKSHNSGGSIDKIKISKQDMKNYKIHTAQVHDPILAAVNEAQPFEQVGGNSSRLSYSQMAEQHQMHDVFGRPIQKPDISNPTRSRDERPLDTIRGFEYAITGDNHYKDRLETDILGFRVRDNFPKFGNGNPYAYNSAAGSGNNSAPVHSFSGGDQPEQGVYINPSSKKATTDKKKKKRSFFGRKHN